MSIEDDLIKIQNKFSFLFNEYRFRIVFSKQFRIDHYSIGLESNICRILFYRELGGWNMFIGMLDATYDSEVGGWINTDILLTFIQKREIDWSALNGK